VDITRIAQNARAAARTLAASGSDRRTSALLEIAQSLRKNAEKILAANAKDVTHAKIAGMSESLLDRLRLNLKRIECMAVGAEEIATQAEVLGQSEGFVRPNGLDIKRIRVPLGVVGIIYEARPNVTVDAAALCLKAGNAVILRGGRDALNSCTALGTLMRAALKDNGLPQDCVTVVDDPSRESANGMMRANGLIDVLIPRGGAGLIRAVAENATVPVIETGVGNCHAFVDESADLGMAANIVDNGKTSRPSVCNALETLLVHEAVAEKFLPMIKQRLSAHNVEIRGCGVTQRILGSIALPATEEDYYKEFGETILAVRVVPSLDAAVEHIAKYSSGHSEVIVTENYENARLFTQAVDSAAVYVNASTRFTDGGEFGFGAEIGISTQKLHARGPMGLRELTTVKYIINGNGQVRS
jgi:glutamate-5-semialdehyde dehydrogenase